MILNRISIHSSYSTSYFGLETLNECIFQSMLLMNEGRTLKVCDFGTICEERDEMTRDKGTISWIAPEIFLSNYYY